MKQNLKHVERVRVRGENVPQFPMRPAEPEKNIREVMETLDGLAEVRTALRVALERKRAETGIQTEPSQGGGGPTCRANTTRGFRGWFVAEPPGGFVPCSCGWLELPNYRNRR